MKPTIHKNILSAIVLTIAAFTFSSCNKETLRGQGDIVTTTRTVGTFDEIDMGGEFEVYLTQGPAKDIVMEGQENVLANIRTTTINNRLKVDFRSSNVKIDEPVRIYITTPTLTEVSMAGDNSVRGLTDWKVDNLKLKTTGSGSIDLKILNADNVESEISGSGQINLSGDAYEHEMGISGSGELDAFELYTVKTDIEISGSGRGEIRASERLDANISGSGKVYYKGNPSVNSSVSGSGSVRKAD